MCCFTLIGIADDSNLCIPHKWRCDRTDDCEDGSDEEYCEHLLRCTEGEEFKCETGTLARWPFFGFCISSSDVCDDFRDCEDGSDEMNCDNYESPCTDDQFRCQVRGSRSGQACIPGLYRCDKRTDCGDQTDEMNCTFECPDGYFECQTSSAVQRNPAHPYPLVQGRGYCIEESHHCDGIWNCFDGSDENHCNDTCTGSVTSFRCKSGLRHDNISACIPDSQLCDGQEHCRDGSDESQCKPHSCNATQFMCSTKPIWYYRKKHTWCLEGNYQCDHFTDCGDLSDEIDCDYNDCEAGKFKCGHKNATLGAICLPAEYVCDNEPNCVSAVDEMGCDNQCSNPAQMPCHSGGQCVDIARRCDGKSDCDDSSDEILCEPSTIDDVTLADYIP